MVESCNVLGVGLSDPIGDIGGRCVLSVETADYRMKDDDGCSARAQTESMLD